MSKRGGIVCCSSDCVIDGARELRSDLFVFSATLPITSQSLPLVHSYKFCSYTSSFIDLFICRVSFYPCVSLSAGGIGVTPMMSIFVELAGRMGDASKVRTVILPVV